MQKILQQGAEAIIIKKDSKVTKDRISKGYRLPILDKAIRKRRTKKEIKLLEKASKIANVPVPKKLSDFQIEIPYIPGKKLSEHLDKLQDANAICRQIGEQIAILHDNDIIHGDLTTSNMIFSKNKVYFIDFGLGYSSYKIEDKAVDLHLIKQALEARHFSHWEFYWKSIEKGYKSSKSAKEVLERLKKVESRGRYKERY